MLCETVTNHTVIFLDRNGAEFDRQLVPDGGKATAPATNPEPENDCFTFTGWDKPFTKVIADLTISPVFEHIEDCVPEGYAQVTFTDLYGNVLEKQLVQIGGTAVAPTPPTIAFYQFIGLSLRHMTLHTRKHMIGDMLESDVQILTYVFLFTHHPE